MPSIRNKSASITKICDTIFHIVYYLIHNGQKKTPLHVSLCECVYDTCRSKTLIQIKNRLGLCISYDAMERIDTGLAIRPIQLAGNNKVPVPKTIDNSAVIHGAVDNYDNEEGTSSVIGGSYDTILMLFQNAENNHNEDQQQQISKVSEEFITKRRSLEQMLECQKFVRGGNFANRAQTPDNFDANRS